MKIKNLYFCVLGLWAALLWPDISSGQDAYYKIALKDLTLTSGALPVYPEGMSYYQLWFTHRQTQPYAVLDGEGEAYPDQPGVQATWSTPTDIVGNTFDLCVRAPQGRDLTGRLFVPATNYESMVPLVFKIPASSASREARAAFYRAKQDHYQELLDRGIPGGAWFRHEKQEAIAAGGGATNISTSPSPWQRPWRDDPEAVYDLFSGGRAVSENLQLDRALLPSRAGDATVSITNLEGITVRQMDWKPLIKDSRPETDPLAACVPADQHAIFFPSFIAMEQVMDEADKDGTPLLQMFEPRSEDSDSRGRYQKQLCLGLNELSRVVGPQLVDSLVFTGSDPYLRMGTDVGILLETKSPEALKTLIQARQAAAAKENPDARAVQGTVDGEAYTGLVSSDRSICSYVVTRSNVVFVSNSLRQLARLLDAAKGETPALVSQDEYIYFRTRYPRHDGHEAAFLILSDATIRRWCSPQWRIASARRMRASALMADQQAIHLDELASGALKSPVPLKTDQNTAGLGDVSLTPRGISSSLYGNINFLTPIIELPLTNVTAAEADSYKRWRDTYQQNWSYYFDPIAARFSMSSNRLGLEVSVMPLILRSEYSQISEFSTGAAIAPDAGDPHVGTLAHLAIAINANSAPVKEGANFLVSMAPGLSANALAWLGQSIAIFADEDPFWDELAKTQDPDKFLETEYTRLPIALRCEVSNPLGLTAFLTAVRAFAEQSSPGMTTWTTEDHQGQPYVKVKAATGDEPGQTNEVAIYYAVTPKFLLVTLNESLLKRALDRQAARATNAPLPAVEPWLGSNLCLQLDPRFVNYVRAAMRESQHDDAQKLAWDNLPILNEWKRRFPNQDPVKLHEQFWQTRLICPGGGAYVWNDEWQTMESTVYGHPGQPKAGPQSFGPLVNVSNINVGLTFENQGVSAKAELTRGPGSP